MTDTAVFARQFADTLDTIRRDPPPVGTAALSGRSPNTQLHRSWEALQEAGVTLTRGVVNYRWRAMHEADPRLAQSIEEVLVFGDALFSAWGARKTPNDLKNKYLEVKQRYAKIVKETETLATPEKENDSRLAEMFSFMNRRAKEATATAVATRRRRRDGASEGEADKPATRAEQKTEERLVRLDTLLAEAHDESRTLLDEAEQDLQAERAFHRATEWFVLAAERASLTLDKATAPGGSLAEIKSELIMDLRSALLIASQTTANILATTEQWLRLKETLHNKSITFLATHENTFTIIQGNLRAWKDIKAQNEALSALSQAVQAGTGLMSAASKGVEEQVRPWATSFVTPEALATLTRSFSAYDESISRDIAALVDASAPNPLSGPRVSPWDNWDATRKALLEPLLTALPPVETLRPTGDARPSLRPSEPAPAPAAEPVSAVDPEKPAAVQDQPPLPPPVLDLHAHRTTWSLLDRARASAAVARFNAAVGTNLTVDYLIGRGRPVADALVRLAAPLDIMGDDEIRTLPQAARAHIMERALEEADVADLLDEESWARTTANDPQEVGSAAWSSRFAQWMKSRDDLAWAVAMRWNDLALDCLILEQDAAQRAAVLGASDAATPDGRVRATLVARLTAFVADPELPVEQVAAWGFAPLLARYAVALNADPSGRAAALLEQIGSVRQPLDWNGGAVNDWMVVHADDLNTPSGDQFQTHRAVRLAGLGITGDAGVTYPFANPSSGAVRPAARAALSAPIGPAVSAEVSETPTAAIAPPPPPVADETTSKRRRRSMS